MRSRLTIKAFVTSTLLLFSLLVPNSPLATALVDPEIPVTSDLNYCTTASDLDCVVSLLVEHPDGTSELATHNRINGVMTLGENGLSNDSGYMAWSYHSGSNNGPSITVYGDVELTPPSVWNINKRVGVGIPVLDARIGGNLENVDMKDYFTITVRTSWLKPQDISMFARGAKASMKIIPGGREWKFSGSKTFQSIFADQAKYAELYGPNSDTTRADEDRPALYWRLDHLSDIPSGSAFDTTCSEFGYTVTASNSSSTGMPSMSDASTLFFNVAAPHFKADGSQNIGYFLAEIPLAWIDCKFTNNTLTKSPKVEISVTDSDGTPQIATTTVSIQGKSLFIHAYGFHYSAPNIVIKGVKTLKTFVCKNGNTKKTFKASQMKCPKGWSLAKK